MIISPSHCNNTELTNINDNSDSDFDIIGITETSQKSNEPFTSNVSISSYNMYSTSSLSCKGGT